MNLENLNFDALSAVNTHGHYCIPKDFEDREVSKLLLSGRVNEPKTLRFIQTVVGDGDVISGGAFVGDLLPAISSYLSPDAQLHSFEPNPQSFAACEVTLKLNALRNVHLHPVAVSKQAGTSQLLVADTSGAPLGGMSTLISKARDGKRLEVEVRTLDDLVDVDRPVSVIHLDVEGSEWAAILGAQRIIYQYAPVLILEASRPWQRKVLQDKLKTEFPSLNYSLFGAMERNCFFIADVSLPHERPSQRSRLS